MSLLLLEIGNFENWFLSKLKRVIFEMNRGYVLFYLFCLKKSIVLEMLFELSEAFALQHTFYYKVLLHSHAGL